MKRKTAACILALMLLTSGALAEIHEGKIVAGTTVCVETEASGILETVLTEVGQTVSAGDTMGILRANKVFAQQDGTVALCNASDGEHIDGTVLEIAPESRYTIYCTTDKAYSSPESTLVHCGEQVYIRCTVDGTHRGVGVITGIDGAEYQVEVSGGELYVGETVYLYRDEAFTKSQRVGIGTVVTSDPIAYEAEGTVLKMHVSEGEFVQRGELLYTWLDADQAQITAPLSGIVLEMPAAQGEPLEAGQVVCIIADPSQLQIELLLSETEAASVRPGDAVRFILASDPEETPHSAQVTSVSAAELDGTYAVRISSSDIPPYIGMSVQVEVRGEN